MTNDEIVEAITARKDLLIAARQQLANEIQLKQQDLNKVNRRISSYVHILDGFYDLNNLERD